MSNRYEETVNLVESVAQDMANAVDYDMGWTFAEVINNPTEYSGKGRPRKTDYAIWKHPLDGKLRTELNRRKYY